MDAIRLWREKYKVPQQARVMHFDRNLFVDFNVPISVATFLQHLATEQSAQIEEIYPDAEDMLASQGCERFCHEIVVPFVRRPDAGSQPNVALRLDTEQSVAAPGGEWIYAKAYCGEQTLDEVLAKCVEELKVLGEGGIIDNWFYLRYADPDPHLRLRIKGNPRVLQERVQVRINSVLRGLLDEGLVWKIQYDTYRRELGRYGGNRGTDIAERIFGVDSQMAAEVMSLCSARWTELRAPIAIGIVLSTLMDCGLSLSQRLALLNVCVGKDDKATRQRRSLAYRDAKSRILQVLLEPECEEQSSDDLTEVRQALRRRSIAAREFYSPWLIECDRCKVPRDQAIRSMLHMSLNRLGVTVEDESNVYDLALRTLKSLDARRDVIASGSCLGI
jgi:thiopeptide-type bacteriocin biosynthesis protein